jgi:uncharacterized repeat protein (TIGR03803 family)
MRGAGALVSWALALCGLVLSPGADAATFRVLHAFLDGSDGATSTAPVIFDGKGNLYGTALQGGTSNNGVVFEITAKGNESVLYSFGGGNDGRRPEAGLVMDQNGNLYGTTSQGGPDDQGTVFKLAPDGTETVLYTFTGGSDGGFPQANLIIDKAGNLYSTTTEGGGNGCEGSGCGTVFKLAPDGSLTTLHTFTGGDDGGFSQAGLIADRKGNLYGTAFSGGANGKGTIFRISARGRFDVLYAFQGGYNDGAYPQAGLILDSSGNFYGTTRAGGGTGCGYGNGCGSIFKLSAAGTETMLYAFTGASDGAEPYGGVTEDASGNLYGTTITGGNADGLGVVFELRSGESLKALHTFEGTSDGAWPEAGVALDTSGNVYGTAYAEGPDGWGTVFRLRQ